MHQQLLVILSSLQEKEKVHVVYDSMHDKTIHLVNSYAATDQLSHRYLVYRDLPFLIGKYTTGEKALDYGSGTGISTHFLKTLGLDVTGVDINACMLEKAREDFPDIPFLNIHEMESHTKFDWIFSSFVLFDLSSKKDIINYLKTGY